MNVRDDRDVRSDLNANATPRHYRATDPDEVTDNLASIGDVPANILPAGHPARTALVWLTSAGYDVYCYASGGRISGTWVAWLGPLADVRPEKDGRVTLADWRASWRALLGEMGMVEMMPDAVATAPAVTETAAQEGRVTA